MGERICGCESLCKRFCKALNGGSCGGLTLLSPICQCANLASPAFWTCILVPNAFQMILSRISLELSKSNKVVSLTQTNSHLAFWHWIEPAMSGCAASLYKHRDKSLISLHFHLCPVCVSLGCKLGTMMGIELGPAIDSLAVMMGTELGSSKIMGMELVSVIEMSGGMWSCSIMELELDKTELGTMSGS